MATADHDQVPADPFWESEGFRDSVRRLRVKLGWWNDAELAERVQAVKLSMERQRRKGQELKNPPGFALHLMQTISSLAIQEELASPLPKKRRKPADTVTRLAAVMSEQDRQREERERRRQQAALEPEEAEASAAEIRKAKRRSTMNHNAALVIAARERLSEADPHDFPYRHVVPDRESAYGRALDWSSYDDHERGAGQPAGEPAALEPQAREGLGGVEGVQADS